MQPKNVRTHQLSLRDDFSDALEKFDADRQFSSFLEATPNGSAIGEYLRHAAKGRVETSRHEPAFQFFYDEGTRKADYLAVWVGLEQYPTAIRHTVENVTPDEAKTIDALTASAVRCSSAQFGWTLAEMQIEREAETDSKQ